MALMHQRDLKVAPPVVLALLYLGLILAGTALLRLPAASIGITWWQALFTATSAVTVTGLVLFDTGATFTLFGEAVIVSLIQLGGLGLMVFAALVLTTLGVRIRMTQRMILKEELGHTSLFNLGSLVSAIFRIALAAELVGVVALAFVFVPESGWWPGLWQAVFHAVSAFNNAGFALWPDSLSAWVSNPIVNLAVPGLLIVGGLGFVVIADVYERRAWRPLMLHSKLMLMGTLVLIVSAWLAIGVLEWRNPDTLGALEPLSRIAASWFMAVTPRTAGFNTIDVGGLHDATALLVILLMVIGGGSASTAGGIKVTTVIVLALATISFIKRREQVHAFGRALTTEQVMKVMALTTISIFTVMTAIFVISISDDGNFLDLAFEVASAFGTTGLSRGGTADLDWLGQAVLLVLMYLGRVGPLTLGFALATRAPPRIRYPEGQVFLG